MYRIAVMLFLAAVVAGPLAAQEEKPVPKNSVRVFVPGCSKGYVFTAGTPTDDTHANSPIPPGTHLRMTGPKKLMKEIAAQEGSQIEITGLVRKGQVLDDGVPVGRARVGIGGPPVAGGGFGGPPIGPQPIVIDVEGWRGLSGSCPTSR